MLTIEYYTEVKNICWSALRHINIPYIDKEMIVDEVLESKPSKRLVLQRTMDRVKNYLKKRSRHQKYDEAIKVTNGYYRYGNEVERPSPDNW